MEKIIQQNNDDITFKYFIATLFSLLTFKRLKRVEKLRKELKEKQDQENDIYKI
ncbi:hypothetical protein [Ornithinibacillus scapharcae]|uniref:hypothetical protein n=1 Tax=Ornithinibacillus scapharcae TaxID=1147159 RepID=UPI000225B58F|nr:hypothetical protein [Ornithinibacillus scapharcae]